jgi:hypothetical protein
LLSSSLIKFLQFGNSYALEFPRRRCSLFIEME